MNYWPLSENLYQEGSTILFIGFLLAIIFLFLMFATFYIILEIIRRCIQIVTHSLRDEINLVFEN